MTSANGAPPGRRRSGPVGAPGAVDEPGPVAAPPSAARRAADSRARGWLLAAHVVAAVVVVSGLAVQVWRPLAPDLGPPPDPATFFSPAHLARVRAYVDPRHVVALVATLLRVAVPCLAAFTPRGRRFLDAVVRGVSGDRRPVRGAAAVGLVVVALTDLVVLPLSFWSGFVHEGDFGLRTQGFPGWLRDWAVAVLPGWLLVAVLLAAASVLVRRAPRAWPAVAGLGAAALTAVLVAVAPLVLEPLRFTFSPLPPGEVRDTVTAVLDRADVDVEAILVADASRRTTKQNAYVSGVGATRRVVLYDTLLTGRMPAEIGVVFAHELGHDRNADLLRGILLAAAGAVTAAYVVAAVVRRRVRRGALASERDPRAAAVVLAVVAVLTVVSLPLQAAVSRRAEAAADLAALDLSADPETYTAMTAGLARANLIDPAPPWWSYLLWSTHPTPPARLEMGRRWPFAAATDAA